LPRPYLPPDSYPTRRSSELIRPLTPRADGRLRPCAGRVAATIAGEWLARRDMAAELRDIRAEHAMPDVPVTVIHTRGRAGCAEALATELRARLVHLPPHGRAPGLRLQPQALRVIADTAL